MTQLVSNVVALDTTPAQQKCGQCDKPAVFAYRWEWGEQGIACAEHAQLLQQTSENLKRSIAIYPIQLAAPAPLTRDERIQLTAKTLVLEADLADAQAKGMDLYRRNGDLQVQLNSAVIAKREHQAQVEDLLAKQREGQARLDQLNAENGKLLLELERLRNLEAFVNDQAAREAHERGLDSGESPTVVDG